MNFGIFSRPGGKGHHDDVIPVHFGKGASDDAKKDALHTFSHQQCIACEKVQKTSHPIIWGNSCYERGLNLVLSKDSKL